NTPPHKVSKDLADGVHRVKMCELLFGEDYYEISDIELKREGKSYTVDTVTELKKLYPCDELFLIIGADMLMSFDRWYRYEDILSAVKLCVTARDDEVKAADLYDYAKKALKLDTKNDEIIIADVEPIVCSSTDVRENLAQGLDVSKLISVEVFNYARLNLLYESPYMNYKRLLRDKLDDYRFLHSLNVAESALLLARMYGGDEKKSYFAGLVHDIMKNATKEEQLQIMEKGDIILSRTEKNNSKLWHAMAGEAYLRTEMGITDKEILSAVRYHTTGKAGMSLLDKIIYIADYISAERNYPDVNVMRELALNEGLDEAALYALKYSFASLSQQERLIHPDSVEYYNELIINKIEKEKA
ncbi:MAG: bis(5'-nucleosyl)-tetraphosphatase (symmetrical) YqeK, partial [Clostridia bacterium]|nr:bis(5'-nucleosyl)-tetraphosphatase (symmetrical) YqeK [Clostridia bacterium]